MAIGSVIPLVLFVVILASVGMRLVGLWRRTRQVPEMSLGFGLVIVAASIPVSTIGRLPSLAMEPIGRVCFSAGLVIAMTGIASMVFFNYWVFRRHSVWGRVLLGVVVCLLYGSVAYMSIQNFEGENVTAIKALMRPATLTLITTLLLAFAWAAAESFQYYVPIRRQVRIGLADPVVANRFLLWGVASLSSTVLMGVIIACVLSGMTILREPLPLAAQAGCGILMSATWYLTFFAPESYRRFIRVRAGLPG